MTFREFSDEFARLLTVYGRVNPNDDQAKEWFKSLGGVSKDDLHKAIDACRDFELEFPSSPAVLWGKIRNIETMRQDRPSCEHCMAGRIFYTRTTNIVSVRDHNLVYDFYAACDCPSGNPVSDETARAFERKGRKFNPQAARYSWLFQRYGGLDTAKGGFGLSAEKMPVFHDPGPTEELDEQYRRQGVV